MHNKDETVPYQKINWLKYNRKIKALTTTIVVCLGLSLLAIYSSEAYPLYGKTGHHIFVDTVWYSTIFLLTTGLLLFLYLITQINNNYQSAYHDQVTGLLRREAFWLLADKYLHRAKRQQQNMLLLIIDLDNFKSLNDQYGHLTGDRVLNEVGQLILNNTRSEDIAARFGGDEFMILITTDNKIRSQQFADNMIRMIGKHHFTVDDSPIQISASVGVAECMADTCHLPELFQRADEDLYREKKNKTLGLNR